MDQALQALLDDPALSDVPREASLQELQALRARAVGDVLTLRIVRLNQQRIDVAVPRGSRVCDLKSEIQRAIAAAEESALGGRHLSWKYVWKTWTLVCDDQELNDPRTLLSEAGVSSGSEIAFRSRTRKRSRRATGRTATGSPANHERRRHTHSGNSNRRAAATHPHAIRM